MDGLEEYVFDYLNKKGMIKACLLHKLLNHFCSPNSNYKIKKEDLLSCLFSLTREKKIDIIILNSSEIRWKINSKKNFTYLKDGKYYIRHYYKNNYIKRDIQRNKNYLFDSRQINFENELEVVEIFKKLLELVKKKKIKYRMIIYREENSKPLNIFEPFIEPYEIKTNKIKPPVNLIEKKNPIFFDLEKQALNLSIIKAYRSKHMCFYITLIDAIHQKIIDLQENRRNSASYLRKKYEYIKKFGYYCIHYVNSDWVNIIHSNPYRWETFFQLLKLPFKILNLEFKNLRFHGRTFEALGRYQFCIYVNNRHKKVISDLKKKGYIEFREISDEFITAIGLDQEIYIPCPSIEYFYFIFKYICYYNLFLLFYHSFDYLTNYYPNKRLTLKEKLLFEIFYPVINEFFTISKKNVSNILVFRYYTFNPDELEVLYNNLMINNVKIIETKMMRYFLVKHSICST